MRACSNIICSQRTDEVIVLKPLGARGVIVYRSPICLTNNIALQIPLQESAISKTFVTPERLPPTDSATKLHSWKTYLQVMVWMCMSDAIDHNLCQEDKLIPLMENSPALAILLAMIHYSYSGESKLGS